MPGPNSSTPDRCPLLISDSPGPWRTPRWPPPRRLGLAPIAAAAAALTRDELIARKREIAALAGNGRTNLISAQPDGDGYRLVAGCTVDRVAAGVTAGRLVIGRLVRVTLEIHAVPSH